MDKKRYSKHEAAWEAFWSHYCSDGVAGEPERYFRGVRGCDRDQVVRSGCFPVGDSDWRITVTGDAIRRVGWKRSSTSMP